MDNDETVVEVKTVKADPPKTIGIMFLTALMIVALALIIYVVKHAA